MFERRGTRERDFLPRLADDPVPDEAPLILFCVGYLCQVFVDEPQRNLALFLVHVVPQQSNYAHEAQETKVVGRLSKSTVNTGIFLSWEEVYLHVLQ